MKPILLILLTYCTLTLSAQQVDNVILVTMDGLRWQELFGGAVDSMMSNEEICKYGDAMKQYFGGQTAEERRAKLMPWMWSTLAKNGQLYGNRWLDSQVDLTNRFWFSYPGYSEILTGYTDPSIDSNDKIYNPNKTILELLNELPEFAGQVAAFGSWDVFPYIVNDQRSGVPVNAGFRKAQGEYLTLKEQYLNHLQDQSPVLWGSVRLDAFTHNYMLEYMKRNHPRVVYISYGETDDFAHDGRYDRYLESAHRTDAMFAELYDFIEADPFYKGRTAIVFTTDHGRGDTPMTEWKSHGTIYKGSNYIWIAAIGPGISPIGEVKGGNRLFQNQVAATVMSLLGVEYKGGKYEAGAPVSTILNK